MILKTYLLKNKITLKEIKDKVKTVNFLMKNVEKDTVLEYHAKKNAMLGDTVTIEFKKNIKTKREYFLLDKKDKIIRESGSVILLLKKKYKKEVRIFAIASGDVRLMIDYENVDSTFPIEFASRLKKMNLKEVIKSNIASKDNYKIKLGEMSPNLENFHLVQGLDFIKRFNISAEDFRGGEKAKSYTIDYEKIQYSSNEEYINLNNEIDKMIKIAERESEKNILYNINQISEIKEKDKINEIEKYIIKELKLGNFENFTFDFNSFIDFSIEKIKFNTKFCKDEFSELSKETLQIVYKKNKNINWNSFLNSQITFEIDGEKRQQKIRKMLGFAGEIKENTDITYILYDGQYFEVKTDYVAEVKREYNKIEFQDMNFDWKSSWTEEEYNQNICKFNEEWINIDKRLIQFDHKGKIEIADIVTPDSLIAVKKYSSAQSISHLANQTATGANLWISNNKKVSTELNITHTKDIKTYAIAIGVKESILKNNKEHPNLSLLSKSAIVNLKRTWKTLSKHIELKMYIIKWK